MRTTKVPVVSGNSFGLCREASRLLREHGMDSFGREIGQDPESQKPKRVRSIRFRATPVLQSVGYTSFLIYSSDQMVA